MARSFSAAKTVSVFVTQEISALVTRRGYAAASQGGGVSSGIRNGAPNLMLKKGSQESAKASWAPDPVTGYYRPESHAKEIDAAELRRILVQNKNVRH